MASADRWLSRYSFKLRNITENLPQKDLAETFRLMAEELKSSDTPVVFQVQLIDGEKHYLGV